MSLPLSFIENRGQMDPRVSYYVQGTTTSVYFTPGGVTFSLTGSASEEASSPELPGERAFPVGWARAALEGAATERHTLKLDFVGATPNVRPIAQDRAPGVVSYFTGPQEYWHTGLPTYTSITYPDLWPGIDLVYSGTGSALKYTFHVHPGADPSQIRLAYRGATGLEVNETGALEVQTPLTTLTENAPYTYQQTASEQVEVASAYTLDRATGTFGFDLGAYDSTRILLIDPVVVVYAGYIGGAGSDGGSGVAVDAGGNAYIAGQAYSSERAFPVKVGPDLTHNSKGDADAFVAKVEASGGSLAYAGYIGGAGWDVGYGVALDEAGNAYIIGSTSSDERSFPVSIGPDLTHNGAIDAFVAKVHASGESLAYAGYIGGARSDYGDGIALDEAGNAYITGETNSLEDSFPVKVGPDLTYNGGNDDAFVAKVDGTGVALVYAGYIGGAKLDLASGVAVDGTGNAYVAGFTSSREEDSFPVKVGPDLTYNGSLYDAFVAKVEASGESLAYAGYIGGAGIDFGNGVAVDEARSAYIAGSTGSNEASFPVNVGPDLTYNGSIYDAYVAKVEASGESLAYAGYIGGADFDFSSGLAVDTAGSAYVMGDTSSRQSTFPVKAGPDLTYNGGVYDAFVAKVAATGEALAYAGYIGGARREFGSAVAVDGAGMAYVTGTTHSYEDSFPTVAGPDLTYNGSGDAFVAKIGRTRGPDRSHSLEGLS